MRRRIRVRCRQRGLRFDSLYATDVIEVRVVAEEFVVGSLTVDDGHSVGEVEKRVGGEQFECPGEESFVWEVEGPHRKNGTKASSRVLMSQAVLAPRAKNVKDFMENRLR